MVTRRKLLISAAALPALSLAGTGTAAASSHSLVMGINSITTSMLDLYMKKKLALELNSLSTARKVGPYLLDVGFTWSLPEISVRNINRIVAYGFGNRPNSISGTTPGSGENQLALPDPGPINELLADTVFKIYQRNPVKIYAQWEIAHFLVEKYQLPNVTSIEPIIAEDGSVIYLSTDGVADAIVELEGGAGNMGKVAIVGHRDHAKRCIRTSRGKGMDAYAVKEVELPVKYDPLSGQTWTRRRDIYLVHDMYAQIAELRGRLIAEAFPDG